ncbi:MAG: hypothetical protein JRH19_20300 [Deltaproteobacteria bacterium]|nr:hypothetical protein [Deltaproteobacteria bacterium]
MRNGVSALEALRGQVARGLTVVALAVMVIAPVAGVADYGWHLVDLWGESVTDKGALAIDGPVGFGLPKQGEVVGKAPPRSPEAEVWVWAFEKSAEIDPGSDIYLNVPSVILYYYGTFFWYPSQLRVDAPRFPITNQESLAKSRIFAPSEFAGLNDRGFEYVVTQGASGGVYLVPLRARRGIEKP